MENSAERGRWSCGYPGAFTLTEVLVVVAIIGILVTIAIPSFKMALNASGNARCIANLRVLHQITANYMNDNDQILPVAFVNTTMFPWFAEYANNDYLHATRIDGRLFAPCLGCPVQRRMIGNPKATTYGMNGALCGDGVPRQQQSIVAPSKTMLFGDGKLLANGMFNVALYQGGSLPTGTHGSNQEKVNLVFVDGHVEGWNAASVPPAAWSGGPSDARMFWYGMP